MSDPNTAAELSLNRDYPDWYYHPETAFDKENVYPLIQIITEEIDRRKGRCIVAYGESGHHNEGMLQHEIELVEALHGTYPIQHVFLEENRDMQPLVNEFETTGIMPPRLRTYLLTEFLRIDQQPNDYKLRLVKTCRCLRIPVHFIDIPDRTQTSNEDIEWADAIEKTVGTKLTGTSLLFAGSTHVMHIPTPGGLTTTVSLLDQQYSGNVLAVSVHPTIQSYLNEFASDTSSQVIANGLATYRLTTGVNAVKASDFKVRGIWRYSRDRRPITDMFDVIAGAPGKYIFKDP